MDFVAIDFETGTQHKNSAISVGLVKYEGSERTDSFYSLIKPPVLYIDPFNTSIHHLTIENVIDAPTFDQIFPQIQSFVGKLPFVAHNAGFDMNVLKATLLHYGMQVPAYKYFDSVHLSRKIFPELESHKLTCLGDYFNIEYDAHNALADADTCAKVILHCARRLISENKIKGPTKDLSALTVQNFLKSASVKFKELTPI
ncbi:MAG: 3'-5' exonuclease [Treponema sp.]|nr:3'-5' exonuclease [Treponema sp.]